ncbi:MAG: class I SAM-dependent methyltransferase [bacterium]|nr:class I SAM-dependent methyltransferase [bacterium]
MHNIYCSYYTNSVPITDYMVKMLQLSSGDAVLEPCAGEGVFIDSILEKGVESITIDALDINKKAIQMLNKEYDLIKCIKIRETDTLFDAELDWISMLGGKYDKIIGNPPYGAWQEYDKRASLKKKYPGYYVKETYSLFLLRCISLLKDGGRLSFIIPDTFMFLNLHKELRRFLLTHTLIEEILIFPSKFFPGVSFGYSNLSIITLKRTMDKEMALNNELRVIKGFQNVDELPNVVNGLFPEKATIYHLSQLEILKNSESRFLLKDDKTLDLTKFSYVLSDFADVVTGFYTGDNTKFIRAKSKSVKGSKNYEVVNFTEVSENADLNGIIDEGKYFIPYVKSASPLRYLRPSDDWYVQWDKETVRFYNSNRKTRFQNSKYYFKKGIAIPMVKSSTIKATAIENRVFDQSIVGIFPREQKYYYYLLAIMNSDVVCKMIHIINPTANNSSNYVKQIPVAIPANEELSKINGLVEQAMEYAKLCLYDSLQDISATINKLVEEIYAHSLSV